MPFIKEIHTASEKERITNAIMAALPLWFSPPEDIPVKARQHRDYPFFAAYNGESCIGFAALKIHNAHTAEICNLGVLENHHRQGTGHGLIAACAEYCRQRGIRFLTVKTLDESANYEPYDRTRAFYHKEGFLPLEVMPAYWNEENPCLMLLRVLDDDPLPNALDNAPHSALNL